MIPAPEIDSFPDGNALPQRCSLINRCFAKTHYQEAFPIFWNSQWKGRKGNNLQLLTEMENLDTEEKLPSVTQPVAEPGVISISGVLAKYFIQLAVFPLSFNYFLHLWTVSWISRLETGPEGKEQVQLQDCCIVSCGGLSARALRPGRGGNPEITAMAFPSTALHCQL